MSDDANKPTSDPDGSTTQPDGDVETLKKQLDAERALREKAEAEAKANRERFELEKAERDKRVEAARKKAEQDGEFEKLAADLKTELEKAKSLVSDYEQIKAERDALVQKRRDALLEQLPADQRDEWKDADVHLIEKAVKLAGTQNIPGSHNGRPGAANRGAKSWADMDANEKAQMLADDPAGAQALIRASRAGGAK